MEGFYDRLWSSFLTSYALRVYELSPKHNGPKLSPPLCSAQFTSVARFRVDSPWISPKTANMWAGHG